MSALTMRERIEQKRKQIAEQSARGIRTYKFPQGKTYFRIVPAADGGDFWRDFGIHYLKSHDGQQKAAIGDRYLTYGEDDTVRGLLDAAINNADNDDEKKFYRDMRASPRVVFQAVILGTVDPKTKKTVADPNSPPDKPQLIEVSRTAFDEILSNFETYFDADEDHDLSSLDRGHLFQVEKSGQGMQTEYKWNATPRPLPLKESIFEKTVDLDQWIKDLFHEKEQKALTLLQKIGVAPASDGSGAAGRLTGPKNSGDANTVTTVEEDDDLDSLVDSVIEEASFTEVGDEVADDEPPFEVEEETKPKTKGKASKPAPEPQDDDDDLAAILDSLDG